MGMTLPSWWQSVILVLLFILVVPLIEQTWIAGILLVIISIYLLYITLSPFLPVALFTLGSLTVLGILPCFVLVTTIALITTGIVLFQIYPKKPHFYALYLVLGLLVLSLIMLYMNHVSVVTVLMGVTVAVMLRSILSESAEETMIEILGVAMAMLLIEDLQFHATLILVLFAMVISFGFGYFAYRFKTADLPGLFSAALIGIILIIFADIRWFILMLCFFMVGSLASRYRIDYKRTLHVEQEKGGARGYLNVFANGIVAAAAAVGYGVFGSPVFIAVYIGSIASATADTIAGEIGVCSSNPRLITNLKRVPKGTNGGITLLGEAAGLGGSALIAGVALVLGIASVPLCIACIIAGFIGTNADSLIGVLLENRGLTRNAGTNYLSTLIGGVSCAVIYLSIGAFFS